MTRPSRHQDQLLIETAKRLLPVTGISGMSLKRVADESGVNLGMFHYYFGSKKKFVLKVLSAVSKDILDEVEEKSLKGATSLERLHSALVSLGTHTRNHREIFISMFQDLLNQEKEVSDFMTAFMGRQAAIMIPLLEAAQKDGSIEKLPMRQCIAFCMASISSPILLGEGIARVHRNNKNLSVILNTELTTDESIEQRVRMALKALSVDPRKVL